MDHKLIFDNTSSKYGSIVELDFTEDIDFTDQDLSDSEKVVIEESVLYQSELREYIKPHSGSKLDSFAKNLLNGDLFANAVSYTHLTLPTICSV